jgi:uncharacterized phage protein (TIGR02220 family)
MKNSFVLYTSYQEQIDLLSMEQRGVLLTAVMAYNTGEELPEMDGMTKMAFSFIKSDLDRDAEKYEKTCQARREAGKQGGRPKTNGKTENQSKAKKANGFSEKQSKAKKPDNEYDNENENDSKESILSSDRPVYEYREIIDYLNRKAGTQYKYSSADTKKHIQARYEQGFTTEDFFSVIDKKVAEWRGTDMEKYLRPSTLFGTKFEGYLNQKTGKKKPDNRFNNFEGRNYDYDDLERQLVAAQDWGC